MEEEWYKQNSINIGESVIIYILPHKLRNISSNHKVMCGCDCCISAKGIHPPLLTWINYYLKKLKYRSHNDQKRRYGEMKICMIVT